MADQDTTVTIENGEKVDKEVETTQVEDENLNADDPNKEVTDTGTDDDEVTEDEDDPNKEVKTDKETEAEFKKRFSQFAGETPEEYLKNLEDAYANSSTEGQRKAKEAKDAKEKYDKVAAFVASNPDFAKALEESENAPQPPVDPALAFARQQMEASYEKDWGDFTGLHPELVDNKELVTELIDELDLVTYAAQQKGRTLSMADGLKKAWVSLGKQAADDKESVVNKTKEQASKPAPGAAKPKQTSGKQEFTPEQIAVAKRMGLSAEDLAKYNTNK